MVACDAAKDVRQVRVAAAVVQRVPGLVQKGLVVVQPARGARDQLHDLRRGARDHACARRFLGTVVQVELDVGLLVQVEAERDERLQGDLRRAVLRVRRLERRQTAHPGGVVARRDVGTVVAEQSCEPGRAKRLVALGRIDARLVQRPRELAEGDSLLLLVALERAGDSRQRGRELLGRAQEVQTVVVERGARLGLDRTELLALGVLREHRQLRLGVPERHLLALEGDAGREQAILELVLTLRELGVDEAGLAGLAQAIEQLAGVAALTRLRLAQRVELLAAEEVGVAADDLRLLGDLLLPHAHGAPLLRALEAVALEAGFEFRWAENRSRRHVSTLASRRATSTSSRGSNGFARTASAAPRSRMSALPVTSATGMPSACSRSRSTVLSSRPRCTSSSTTSGRSADRKS